jgi:hypothetical protein
MKDFLMNVNWTACGFIILLILGLYVLIMLKWYQHVIISKNVSSDSKMITSEQIYYLPTANIIINATAKIAVTKRLDNATVISAKLYEMSFDNQVQLQADENQLFSLHYNPTWVASDDIKLGTSSQGLLENIDITAEDRFAQLVTQIAEVPKKITGNEKTAGFLPEKDLPLAITVTNLTPFTKSFVLYEDVLSKPETVFDWKISIDGNFQGVSNIIDASFQIKIPKPLLRLSSDFSGLTKPLSGVITRPLRKLTLLFHMKRIGTTGSSDFEPTASLTFQAMVPDTAKLFVVPIKRVLFSKYVHTQKFASGMLIENHINKPSEAENLIAIPITIAKAIFAIPAQLFSFKITKIQQQNSLETEKQKFAAATKLNDKTASKSNAEK